MLVFFDIDGTLITEDGRKYLPESTVRAIKTLRKNGHQAFINSGRTLFNVIFQPYVRRIGFDGYVCACGAHIIYEGHQILNRTAPPECHDTIVSSAKKYRMELMLEGPEALYYEMDVPFGKGRSYMWNLFPARRMDADLCDKCFNKFVTWTREDSDREAFIHAVSPWFDVIERGNGFLEYCLHGTSKQSGIETVRKLCNEPLDHCFVIGDSRNDESMLAAVPHSILMGNGDMSMASMCEYVTDTVENDGIEKALKHYGLI